MNWQSLLSSAMAGDTRSIARSISLVEDEGPGYQELLRSLPGTDRQNIIGITGPPGAGKSTLTDGLIGEYVKQGKRVAVLCVDPSSPFNLGALLGDRIRMSDWYTHPSVFIRSLATRGSLGGLHPRILEITDLLKALPFDLIIIETVGVGQSEIEIAGLADCTMVVLVPEAGDEVQTMKAGLMEIADVFVINKSDRPDADHFTHYLQAMVHASGRQTPVIRTVATEKKGLDDVAKAVEQYLASPVGHERRYWLLAERAYNLMRNRRMKDISKQTLKKKIEDAVNRKDFNLYTFIEEYTHGK
jgi:LAO/AO transport system kinase